jgi:uncharacterized protein YjeT (DUF2065 family)
VGGRFVVNVVMLETLHLHGTYSTDVLGTVQTYWVQYRRIGYSTNVLGTVQTYWVQYRRIGYSTDVLGTVQTYWVQYRRCMQRL